MEPVLIFLVQISYELHFQEYGNIWELEAPHFL